MSDLEIIRNSNGCVITYAAIRKAMKGEPFEMSMTGREVEVLIKVVNIGIDSRLQACNGPNDSYEGGERSFIATEDGPRWKKGDKVVHTRTLECSISPESLPVLLRRLYEDTEYTGEDDDDNDVGSLLANDILTCLGFNEMGKFVGRKALGLE